MTRITYITAFLIGITALIGTCLWVNGFPPEKEGLSDFALKARQVITFPLFWAGLSTAISVPILRFKAKRLNSATGKARMLPQIAMLAAPITMLFAQIMIPLDFYNLISEKSVDLGFYGLITAFFLLVGNYVVTIPFESRLGFRTKATLSNSAIWTKSHRFLGRNIVLISLLMIPTAIVTSTDAAQWALVAMIFLIKAFTYIYARQLSTRATLHSTPT